MTTWRPTPTWLLAVSTSRVWNFTLRPGRTQGASKGSARALRERRREEEDVD